MHAARRDGGERQRHAAQLGEVGRVEVAAHQNRGVAARGVVRTVPRREVREQAEDLRHLLGAEPVLPHVLRVPRQVHGDHDDALAWVSPRSKQDHQRATVLHQGACFWIYSVDEVDAVTRHELELLPLPEEGAPVVRGLPRPLSVDAVVAVLREGRPEKVVEVVALNERDNVGVEVCGLLNKPLPPRLPPEVSVIQVLNAPDLVLGQDAANVVGPALIPELARDRISLVELVHNLRATLLTLRRSQIHAVQEPRLCVLAQVAGEDVVLRNGELQRHG
mmetsp:Transcript_110380/g.276344  ORF Transcript_110380/g.276344 Transcript_110380/m.276344 type:complete len:277 (-) Transcript_110380:80-910(-)